MLNKVIVNIQVLLFPCLLLPEINVEAQIKANILNTDFQEALVHLHLEDWYNTIILQFQRTQMKIDHRLQHLVFKLLKYIFSADFQEVFGSVPKSND